MLPKHRGAACPLPWLGRATLILWVPQAESRSPAGCGPLRVSGRWLGTRLLLTFITRDCLCACDFHRASVPAGITPAQSEPRPGLFPKPLGQRGHGFICEDESEGTGGQGAPGSVAALRLQPGSPLSPLTCGLAPPDL